MAGSALGHYERGTNSPTVKQLVTLINALEVPGETAEERLAQFFLGPNRRLLTNVEASDLTDYLTVVRENMIDLATPPVAASDEDEEEEDGRRAAAPTRRRGRR